MPRTLFQPFDQTAAALAAATDQLDRAYTIPEGEVPVPALGRRKDGRYNGAPGGQPMDGAGVTALVNRLTEMALSDEAVGDESKYWYEFAGEVIRNPRGPSGLFKREAIIKVS